MSLVTLVLGIGTAIVMLSLMMLCIFSMIRKSRSESPPRGSTRNSWSQVYPSTDGARGLTVSASNPIHHRDKHTTRPSSAQSILQPSSSQNSSSPTVDEDHLVACEEDAHREVCEDSVMTMPVIVVKEARPESVYLERTVGRSDKERNSIFCPSEHYLQRAVQKKELERLTERLEVAPTSLRAFDVDVSL